ncbi:MAG: hypothetical protein KDC12_14605, partial [Flavobacteriales bacterium]|nr:hypothetical protein [Flavobacteriales bacterium]
LGSSTQSGNTTFYANAGDLIGFGIESTDGGFGEGWVLISKFTYAPQTCGCTDNTACNFDPNADINDGSCCYTNCFTFNVGGGTFDSEISWEVYDDDNNLVYTGGAPYNEPFCLSSGCYNIIMYDSFGDSWNGASWTLSNAGGVVATGTHLSGSMSQSFLYGVNTTCVPGCTSPIACNYNASATIDDGSCTYPGCTDVAACNYDPNAGCSDGSCTFTQDDCSLVCTNTSGDAMGFIGTFDPFNWTFQTSPGNGWIEGSVGYMAIAGTNNDLSLNSGVVSQASIVAQYAGEYTFTWTYATLDGPQYDFAYYINDVQFLLTSELGGVAQSGTITMNVNAGDIIGFGINATDGVFGRGYLLITDFTWPNVVCGCTDMNACNYNDQAIFDDGSCEYASCACPGDLNNDGMVDTLDLLLFLGAFGCTGTCLGDMDNSGAVNTTDLLIFLGLFGTDCSVMME